MKAFSVGLVFVLVFTESLLAQLPMIERTVVQLDLETPVVVPVGETFIVIFLPGNTADPFGPTPPNGDLVFVGGNYSTALCNGYIASASCDLYELFNICDIFLPPPDFLIAGANASGEPLLSNHDDVTSVSFGSGSACISSEQGFENRENRDNVYAQEFDVTAPVAIESVLVGIEIAIEGNNELGVDSDGDGVGDSAPILDGFIPAQVMFFFGVTPTFNVMGPDIEPDAEFSVFIQVDYGPGDVNQDGAVDLADVAPFVNLISSGIFQSEGDINDDNIVDLLDVAPFVELLTGG